MTTVACFTFNAFQENTYILYDSTKECVIIDPGCQTAGEEKKLADFIQDNELKPVHLLNTHCHIDHVFGNKFVVDRYNLPLSIHKGESIVLQRATQFAGMMGIPYKPSPPPRIFLKAGTSILFGNTQLDILFTPGHSPASISFYCPSGKFVIGGDVLFRQSIGRTDLPGGNFATLIQSIRQQLYPLGDSVKVYSGHGPVTTIGYEKLYNPFLNSY